MKHNVMLTIASLLSILFGTFHLADDIARGMSPGGLPNLFAVVICVVWLYGVGSGNSDAGFSGNSGAQSSGNSGRFELTPTSHTLAVPNSEGRDDRHAQTARDSGASTRGSQSDRNRHARRRVPPKRSARRT